MKKQFTALALTLIAMATIETIVPSFGQYSGSQTFVAKKVKADTTGDISFAIKSKWGEVNTIALQQQLDKVLVVKSLTSDNPETIKLTNMLKSYSVTPSDYSVSPYHMLDGYGETHEVDGYKVRVDRPASGDSKPHVHVDGKGKSATENVDGTDSHGTNMTKAGIPKKTQDKIKQLGDYQKAQKDLKNMQKAKSEINAKHLNLNNPVQLTIAIGVFIAVTGLVIFAPEGLPLWGSLIAAI